MLMCLGVLIVGLMLSGCSAIYPGIPPDEGPNEPECSHSCICEMDHTGGGYPCGVCGTTAYWCDPAPKGAKASANRFGPGWFKE